MLIGGLPFDENVDLNDQNAFAALLQALKNLPSGFAARTRSKTQAGRHQPDTEAYSHTIAAFNAHKEWERTKDNVLLERALTELQLSAEAGERTGGNALAQAGDLFRYASLCRSAGQAERGIPAAEKALSIFQQQGNCFDALFANIGPLYADILNISFAKEQEGNQQEADRMREKLRPLREQMFEAFTRIGNEPVDLSAHHVAPGDVGFSNGPPLGAMNVQDCILLILWNPDPNRDPLAVSMAMAHGDWYVAEEPETFNIIWDALPSPPPSMHLQGKLVGVRHLDKSSNNPLGVRSRDNLKKVSNWLKDKGVNIVSTDFLDAPAAIVASQNYSSLLNQYQVSLTEAVPRLGPDAVISEGRQTWDRSNRLRVAFNLAISSERAPILMNEAFVASISTHGNNEKEIYDWFKNRSRDIHMFPLNTHCILSLKESHDNAVAYVSAALDDKCQAWRRFLQGKHPGVVISPENIQQAKQIIAARAIHIGEGAEQANQPLLDEIKKLRIKVENGTATFDVEKLKQVRFPEQPYEAIAQRARQQQSVRSSARGNKRQRTR